MPMRAKTVGMAMALLVLAGAGLRGEDEKKLEGDLKKVQGKWTADSGSGDKVTYTFKEKTLKVDAPSRKYTMTVTLDEKAKPEKTIDFKIDEGPEDAKGQTSKGIYKFDGDDKLTICFAPMGERPDKFEMVGYEKIIIELKRDKDAK
jgi:uncharacterized protein (TIGR03067 family)